jgi:HD-GYP domain-containing protein (c-di-GMP phosphodiesterase class II)
MSTFSPTHPSHLELLNRLSQEFNSSLHVDVILNKVIDEVIQTIQAERGFVMLKNDSGQFIFRVARGMNHQSINDPDFQISRSIVEQVKREGQPVLTSDAMKDERFQDQQSVVSLGLRSILCVPLKSDKDGVTGTIYLENRMHTGMFSKTDLALLSAIASNAAIAIKNASLYEELAGAYVELENAYEETLMGWAKAVELRDQVTEEHTQRVARLTVHLAQYINLTEGEIIHIRRGAMMHDIGKLGIPDGILLKTDRLTPAEFEIMKLHTTLARDMIYPIKHLRPAIDIPFCHHEKWDGSGYPRGLRREDIPLAARLFAIVDVWDALRSNRPYRSEWSHEKVVQYIQEQSGLHFDPGVVRQFLSMISEHPDFVEQ